jgi:hypothetical protein
MLNAFDRASEKARSVSHHGHLRVRSAPRSEHDESDQLNVETHNSRLQKDAHTETGLLVGPAP